MGPTVELYHQGIMTDAAAEMMQQAFVDGKQDESAGASSGVGTSNESKTS
jgi:hypothetical protein